MTYKEAINEIEYLIGDGVVLEHIFVTLPQESVAALEVAIEALEKMTPTKPNWIYEDEPMCPNCGEIMDDGENPCECCNQLIDWSE